MSKFSGFISCNHLGKSTYKKTKNNWTKLLSVSFKAQQIFFYYQCCQVATARGLLLVRGVTQDASHCLILPKPCGSKHHPPRKAFFFFLSFNVKMKFNSEKTTATAVSTLISQSLPLFLSWLLLEVLRAACSRRFLVSSQLKGQYQAMLRPSKNTPYRSGSRWVKEILGLNS